MSVALLCPGQGAQAVGMGKDFYDRFGVAARIYETADKALGFSLSRLCFEGPEDQLNKTDVAQLAIYVTSVAIFETLLELGKATAASGETGTAEKLFRRVLDQEQTSTLAESAHFQLAQIYRKQGRVPDADREMKLFQEMRKNRK